MNPRDFLTSAAIGLVVLVGGLAIADSVRGCDRSDREVAPPPAEAPTTTPTTSASFGPGPRPEAPEDWPEGTLDGVLTFVDADTCRIRAIGLSGGRERPLQPYPTDCGGLWAPKVGARIAYETFFSEDGITSFRIADLGHGDRDFGEYASGAGRILWSFDGQRVAWCDTERTGGEREVLGGARPLPFCPVAYTPEGELARAVGNRLVVGTRTVLTASGSIGSAQFGLDGSIGVLVDGPTLERYADGEPTVSTDLPTGRVGDPVFSPDTCAAATPFSDEGSRAGRYVPVPRADGQGMIVVFPLCAGGDRVDIAGRAPSWSPDGEWLAFSRDDMIFFIRMDGRETLAWPASAAHLVWRAS